MKIRTLILWVLSLIFTISFVNILNLNIEKLAEREDWTSYVMNTWDGFSMPSVEFSFLAQEWAHPIFWFLFGATTIAWLFKLFPENESGFSNRVLNSFKNWFVLHAFGIQWLDGPHSIHTFGYVMSRPHNMCLVNYIRLRGVNRKKAHWS